MGEGSLAYLASAATVAASSLEMRIADPRPLVARIDPKRFTDLLRRDQHPASNITLSEPDPRVDTRSAAPHAEAAVSSGILRGAVQLFGDNVDTDAIIPGEFCHLNTLEALGQHAFHHVRPEFSQRAAGGQNLVVAGEGWGSGSSREHAVWALKGAGIQAFIHKRNLVNEAVPFLVVRDPEFHARIKEGTKLRVDPGQGTIEIEDLGLRFSAEPLSPIVRSLSQRGGLVPAVKESGTQVFAAMAQ
jgi:3-isopropylmalate dehydratase small subunit